jgi:threonine synthase
VPAAKPGPSVAEEILAPDPPRARQILRELADTGGAIIAVDDTAVWQAQADLGRSGIYAEPTAAVAFGGVSDSRGRVI